MAASRQTCAPGGFVGDQYFAVYNHRHAAPIASPSAREALVVLRFIIVRSCTFRQSPRSLLRSAATGKATNWRNEVICAPLARM
jgi:hypothetical protein